MLTPAVYALALFGGHEHRIMFALDLFQLVTEDFEKVLVGGYDRAIECKFDH